MSYTTTIFPQDHSTPIPASRLCSRVFDDSLFQVQLIFKIPSPVPVSSFPTFSFQLLTFPPLGFSVQEIPEAFRSVK